MSNTRIVIVLFILSESLVAFYAAQSLWRSRSQRDGKRTTLGILVALGCVIYGVGQSIAFFNSFKYAKEIAGCLPPALELRSLISSAVRCAGWWTFALTFAGGNNPGPIRRRINLALERLR